MAYFPFFIDIHGKSGLIVGGGRMAYHKVSKLLPYEPKLTVVAPEIREELRDDPTLICVERAFRDSDVEGKAFVISATADIELNAHVSQLCQERNILVNVVDDKEKCGFLFPSLINEGALSVGISTGGSSPQVAARLRGQWAERLPDRMAEILDYLAGLRMTAKERIGTEQLRSIFLKEAADLCLELERSLTDEETETQLARFVRLTEGSEQKALAGSVTLVGAGCGAYDLITVRGMNAIRSAQVLVYDDLIDTTLLDFAAESCEKIYVGKRSGRHSHNQEEINQLLIEKSKEGKRVVRLKGGDPYVFGRGGEEFMALRAENIEVREIPGITSAIAVPALAGIPVTHRGVSKSFHVITGHTANLETGLPEDWETLANLEGTCIYLMGIGHLEQIAEKLLGYGKAPDTPVAIIHAGVRGEVDIVRGRLDNIVAKMREKPVIMPSVIVIGDAAGIDLHNL